MHWTTVLYEMLEEYGIGFNVWCHKAVERPDAPTLLTYELPEGFEKIRGYALEGKGKPSFAESQKIFDAYLENIKFNNCKVHTAEANAILRTPSVTIPAIGFDVLPGKGISYSGSFLVKLPGFCGEKETQILKKGIFFCVP